MPVSVHTRSLRNRDYRATTAGWRWLHRCYLEHRLFLGLSNAIRDS